MGMNMDYKDVGIVVLAAGKGTRMNSDIAKVLHKVGAKSMIVHVIECAKKIAAENIYVVIGHQAQLVKDEVNRYFKVNFAFQEQLLGTGDAVKAVIPWLKSGIKDILVLCGDVPLVQENTLRNLVNEHKKKQVKITVLATDIEEPGSYGRIVLDEYNHLLYIKEYADATEIEKKIKKVNTGIYCFDKELLISAINKIKPDNIQVEYYLTDVIGIAKKQNESIQVLTMDDPREVMGVNTLEDLCKVECLIQRLGK
ncbi:UDP-N-acetylglucosamine pyrophosphorylase [Desulfobacula phenolica]|uniref:UDP-N-acetylglucosamine pyrophosphorylase n=2 Tax=Desulfobacula phenolica TaxID=90732 RepID=A0A1H2G581_9BACT|nr:UDP-N-acetylglucosamine pyrophosphorylase [Desulfobacula phenolica]